MNGEPIRPEEKDALLNDLLQDSEELKEASKAQGERLNHLEQAQKDYVQKLEERYSGLRNHLEALGGSQQPADLSLLTSVLREGLEEIKEEVKKQHCQLYQTKHYSLFGDRFGSDHFKKVMDTVMKWVIGLIVALNVISIIKFLIHFE